MDEIPALVAKKTPATILPHSSQLRDPMKSFSSAVKENIPATQAATKKQTTLTQHIKHTFAPMPKVKKSTAVLGNFKDCLPSRIRHRVCPLCLRIFKNKMSYMGIDTPCAHIQNSSCPFVKMNFTNQIGVSKRCFICFELFTDGKLFNENVIEHFSNYNHPVRCSFCSEVMEFNSLYEHLVKKSYALYEQGITCNKCKVTFNNVQSFFSHFSKAHGISKPNVAHLNKMISIKFPLRELAMFAGLHYGTKV